MTLTDQQIELIFKKLGGRPTPWYQASFAEGLAAGLVTPGADLDARLLDPAGPATALYVIATAPYVIASTIMSVTEMLWILGTSADANTDTPLGRRTFAAMLFLRLQRGFAKRGMTANRLPPFLHNLDFLADFSEMMVEEGLLTDTGWNIEALREAGQSIVDEQFAEMMDQF